MNHFLGAREHFLGVSKPFLGARPYFLVVMKNFLGEKKDFLGATERLMGAWECLISAGSILFIPIKPDFLHYTMRCHFAQEHWVATTAWAGSAYIVLIFAGQVMIMVVMMILTTLSQAWMATRPAYQLRGPLAAWSTFLAVFSMVG